MKDQSEAERPLTRHTTMQTLTSHVSTRFPPSPAFPSPPASPPDPHQLPLPPPALSAKSALETALLLLSKHALAPDAWVAAAPNEAGTKAGAGTRGSGKKQHKRRGVRPQSEKGAKGKGKGKKRRRMEEEVEEDEELVLEREDNVGRDVLPSKLLSLRSG